MIHELERSCAGASLFPVNDDEIRIDIRHEHRLANCEELPRMSDAKLEARGLAVRRISPMKPMSLMGVENTEWLDGEMQSFPMGTPRVFQRKGHTA